MPEDVTQQFIKDPEGNRPVRESALGGVSIRAWLALLITATTCTVVGYLSIQTGQIDANFLAQFGMILAFYFAQKEKPKGS